MYLGMYFKRGNSYNGVTGYELNLRKVIGSMSWVVEESSKGLVGKEIEDFNLVLKCLNNTFSMILQPAQVEKNGITYGG